MIEDIYPKDWQETRGVYSPAKKIDLGNAYLIFVSGQQVNKNESNEAVTGDVEKQTESEPDYRVSGSLKSICGAFQPIIEARLFSRSEYSLL